MKAKMSTYQYRKDAEGEDFRQSFHKLVTGELSDTKAASFLTTLHAKGETAEEIAAAASELRKQSLGFDLPLDNLVDNCGTGGINSHTFNISTTAAFITAGAGAHVAKHGNRSVSSQIGFGRCAGIPRRFH